MSTEKIRMRLSIMQSAKFKTQIILKSKKFEPFIAIVEDFNYDEDATKVILKRTAETVFPNEIEGNQQENYVLYVKDIKEVDRHE